MFLISLLALQINAHAGSYVDEFQKLTNFHEGDYSVVKGGRQCLDGDVVIREVAPQAVSIKIGARLLVDAVGLGSNVRLEGDQPGCDYDRTSEPPQPNLIQSRKIVKCGDAEKVARYYKIEVIPNGFVTTVTQGSTTHVCVYGPARPESDSE